MKHLKCFYCDKICHKPEMVLVPRMLSAPLLPTDYACESCYMKHNGLKKCECDEGYVKAKVKK